MTAVWAFGGAILVLGLLFKFKGGSGQRELALALRTQDIGPIVGRIESLPAAIRPDRFNATIRRLWDDYERELAARLIRAFAERHSDTPIAQYWLDQLRRVEPDIAADVLEPAFLAAHFDPSIAASCGSFG